MGMTVEQRARCSTGDEWPLQSGWLKTDLFFHALHAVGLTAALRLEKTHDFLDQTFRRRGARCNPHPRHAGKPRQIDVTIIVD